MLVGGSRPMTNSGTDMPGESVLVDVRPNALWITLNRPMALNSITPDMVAGITAALARADDPEIKAVVLIGTGRTFCAGADLKYVNSATQGGEKAPTPRFSSPPPPPAAKHNNKTTPTT